MPTTLDGQRIGQTLYTLTYYDCSGDNVEAVRNSQHETEVLAMHYGERNVGSDEEVTLERGTYVKTSFEDDGEIWIDGEWEYDETYRYILLCGRWVNEG